MTSPEEALYFELRAEQEQHRAKASADTIAAAIHDRLAAEYRARANLLVLPHLKVR